MWKILKNKLTQKPMLDKLMIFWSNIIKKHTNFMIRSSYEFDAVIKINKKLVVILWHPLCKTCQKIMITLPFVYIKLKFKWYNLKFCNVQENKEIWTNLKITKTPTLVIYEDSKLIKKIDDEKEVISFLY